MTRRARRRIIVLPVVVTLVAAVVVGVLVVAQDHRQRQQVARADHVAQDYLADVARFRTAARRAIAQAQAREQEPADLRRVVRTAIARPPTLRDAPDFGKRASTSYAQAVLTRTSLLAPYRRLMAVLARARASVRFVSAARDALELRATDYVGTGILRSSTPVRDELVPAFVQARDTFDAVPVPSGQRPLARTVHGALQHVIDESTTLAAEIEAGRSYSFTYAEQFRVAQQAVDDYAARVNGELGEAINAVTSPS